MPRSPYAGARFPRRPASPTPAFACGGYDICDRRLASHREVVIRAPSGRAPLVGEAFTIMRGGRLHDLTVLGVLSFGADWAARCGVAAA